RLPDGSQRLLLAIHHLVVDGVSWRILLEDLHSAYQAAVAGQPPKLPAKTSAFKAWAERLQAHAQSPAMLDELAAWEAHLRGAPATLPCDRPAGRALVSLADSVRTSLPPAVTRQLLQQAPAAYRTQVNDLLLTALARVICRWSGEPSALLQLEGHGREQLFDDLDLSRTVGWFTSLYPVHLQPADDLSTSIKAVKEQLRSVPGKGLTYGLLRYMAAPDVASQLARWAQPRITFNYLGQFDGQFDEQALLRPATEPAGAEMDAQAPLGNWLSLNGQVYDGTLQIDWTFSREQYDRTTVQALADAYAE
ncbi:condensation domain-containing protein, partial [Pseudomonas sp. RIT-PI-S]|uniref:condensation domain-containing protein n=1 Tax=Pseudomonas sp. RIT-PI-S TaxID=3035295 RepID=UPI0021D8AC9D